MEPLEVNRRGFVSGIVAAGAGAAFGVPLGGDVGADSSRPFKVCVFADIHFDDFWTNSDDTSFLDGIMARAEREKCDMMIHLGDFMHGVDKPRQRIFAEANAKRPGTVRLVMNGHNHNDNLRILDGIPYWDVNSANYQWFGKRHDKYPSEYVKRHPGSVHILGWTKPLSAILSLWPDGRVRIEGSEADWLFGVTAKAAGFPVCDADGRETHPKILSADFRLFA